MACRGNSTSPSTAAARWRARGHQRHRLRRDRGRRRDGVPAGTYFRLQLGGITGHGDFASDAGVLVGRSNACRSRWRCCASSSPRATAPTASARGSNTCSTGWASSDSWPRRRSCCRRRSLRLPLAACRPRAPVLKHGHIGIHAQRQAGLFYIGVALPVGRLSAAQMRGLAALARRHGSGTLRLTVWQNLLISDIPGSVPGGQGGARHPRPRLARQQSARRTGGMHRQYRLQILRHRHQGPGAGARSSSRKPPRPRSAGQHPPDGLPAFLRAALCRRYRAARRQARRGGGRGLRHLYRRRHRQRARARRARSIRRCPWPRCRAASKGCCATISPSAASPKASSRSPGAARPRSCAAGAEAALAEANSNELYRAAAARERALQRAAARLDQWLARRPSRRRGRVAAPRPRRPRSFPGTIRRCRWRSACGLPKAARASAC